MDADKGFGFSHPGRCARFQRRRSALLAELVASLALVLSILVSATAVGMGIAHAEVLQGAIDETARLAVAMLVSLLLVGMGGLTALMSTGRDEARPHK